MKFLLWALLAMVCASTAFAEDVANQSAAANAATVVSVKPAALLNSNEKAGGSGDKGQAAKALREGDSLYVGDRVTTDEKGLLTMILVDGSEFNMAHNSDMTLKSIGAHGAGGGIFRLLKGMMQGAVHKLADGEHLIIETPSGVAAVKGTQYQVEASDEKTELKVLSGRVDLSDPAGKGDLIVGPGQAAMSYPDRVGALRTMNRDEVESLKASFAVKVRQAQSDYLKRVKAIRNEP